MTTVETIEFIRKSKSMSKYELCKKADISQSTISNWNDRSEPSLKALEKVCVALILHYLNFFCLEMNFLKSLCFFVWRVHIIV